MIIAMKSRLLLLAATTLIAFGCAKTEIIIVSDEGGTSGSGSGAAGSTLVTFHATVESRNITRSLSPISKNVRAYIYAFSGTATNASGSPIEQGAYQTANPGLLVGLDSYNMTLPNGTYNFYAVSDNTPFRAPSFSEGISAPLVNGIDYLWWSGQQQTVTSQQASIPIVFMHSATQVSFELSAGQGITINQFVLAHLKASTEDGTMNLSTGIITPATGFQTAQSKMGVNGNLAQYIMLPVKTSDSLWVSFDVIVNDENTARTYEVEVPLPGGELKSGDSYRFAAVIEANTVTFPSVDVRSWVNVDETGKPLYPKE